MLVLERTAAVEQPGVARVTPSPNRRWPVVAMAAGLAFVGAAFAVVHSVAGRDVAPVPVSSAITLAGPGDVTVQGATYQPGQTSGWHSHTGMHAVMVLSGTVTFYDGQCQGRSYGPGETYVGGQDVHVVRNETVAPAELAVTYLFPAGQAHTTFHVDARPPAGCDVR
jgi:quercetin dioxygenase-like cupin family protein